MQRTIIFWLLGHAMSFDRWRRRQRSSKSKWIDMKEEKRNAKNLSFKIFLLHEFLWSKEDTLDECKCVRNGDWSWYRAYRTSNNADDVLPASEHDFFRLVFFRISITGSDVSNRFFSLCRLVWIIRAIISNELNWPNIEIVLLRLCYSFLWSRVRSERK